MNSMEILEEQNLSQLFEIFKDEVLTYHSILMIFKEQRSTAQMKADIFTQ